MTTTAGAARGRARRSAVLWRTTATRLAGTAWVRARTGVRAAAGALARRGGRAAGGLDERFDERFEGRFDGRRFGWRPALAHGVEAGMATAEYAIATLAAVGFAGLLLVILKGDEVRGLLLGIIKSALSVG